MRAKRPLDAAAPQRGQERVEEPRWTPSTGRQRFVLGNSVDLNGNGATSVGSPATLHANRGLTLTDGRHEKPLSSTARIEVSDDAHVVE